MNINIIDNKTQIVIISLFIGAIGIKAAIVPFHSWLVSAHSTAPTPISAILSGITVKAGVYIFIRIFTLGCFTLENLNEILIILGAITALGGVIGALVEWDIKRLIAYHTISQMGFIIVGIGTLSYIGIVGGIYHIVNHAIFKSLLFLCAGSIIFRTGSKDIRDHGIKKTMPITLITYIIAVLAISGVTPFNGSVSKYLIEQSIYAYQFVWIILICASIGTVVTFLKILYYSFIKTSIKNPNNNYQEVPISMQIPMIILAFLCILLGILPNLWIDTFISPASTCVLGQISNIESNFFEPVYILKEWIIVGLGLVALKIIIFRKKDIDKLRGFFSKFDMNICIFIMIFSITFILLLLTIS